MRLLFSAICVILFAIPSFSQTDSIVFKNGNYIIGEIKSMNKGVLEIETEFSDSDFKIEWDGIKLIQSETIFFILTSNKSSHHGRLESTSDSTINIISTDNLITKYNLDDIVTLLPFKKTFKDRFKASIDIGFSLTKASNLKQFTSRSSLGYKAEKWMLDGLYNTLRSTHDGADTIQRHEAGVEYKYLFFRKYYISATISALSNTEQNLSLRNNSKIGLGKYIIHTNRSYWTVLLGMNRNIERFTDLTANRKSWEPYLGTVIDLFDIGDFNLLTRLNAYKSITEKGRWRLDGVFDVKYDLPLDLYIKAGISLNYDNQPAHDASNLDYVLQTGIGWEW